MNNLRALVEDCRKDEPLMERVAAVLGITALIFLSITLLRLEVGYVFAAPQAPSSSYPPAIPTGALAGTATFSTADLASMVTACMSGRQFTWVDPHTGADMAAFCEVEVLGRIGR